MEKEFIHIVRLLFQAFHRLLPGVALVVFVTGCQLLSQAKDEVPFDLKRIIPKEWAPVSKLIEINVDDDEAVEWLLFYRYDVSRQRKESEKLFGPIGGVVFDRQIDAKSGASILLRHDLLPDIREGKGQGFLGEEKCDARVYRITTGGSVGEELAIFGYAYGPIAPVYLSIFRRTDDVDQGYRFESLGNFYGNGGISIDPSSGDSSPIQKVIVKTRLNERSLISKRAVFARQDDSQGAIAYIPKTEENCLEFTYGVPENPYYPEAAVLAYYQLLQGGQSSEADKFVLPDGERQNYWQKVHGSTNPPPFPAWPGGTVRILTLSYTGASKIVPGGSESPFYYTTVEVEESTGATKIWEVFGLLDGRCGAEICWQLMSSYPK